MNVGVLEGDDDGGFVVGDKDGEMDGEIVGDLLGALDGLKVG